MKKNDIIRLKQKAILTPYLLKDDEIIQAMWNGKITDLRILQNILDNIPTNIFSELLNYDINTSEKGLFYDLAKHFDEVNLSTRNIAQIMLTLLKDNSEYYEVAKLLANVDIPEKSLTFKNSSYASEPEYSWICRVYPSISNILKNINNAQLPFLPYDFYIKKLDKKVIENSYFIENLITLLHSDYFSSDEKRYLKDKLQKNFFWKDDQVLPIEQAKQLINDDLLNKIYIDKTLLKSCIQSIICNTLRSKGIDIQNKVFFGNSNKSLGHYNNKHNYIWINDNLLEKYLTPSFGLSNKEILLNKASLFETVFHEMRHAVQKDKIDNGKFDYLSYNILKEEIISEYDMDYYKNNYKSIFAESDARKEGLLGTLDFLNGLNSDFVQVIKDNIESNYIFESQNTIYRNSDKQVSIEKISFIDVSDYLSLLIKGNQKILIDNPILNIEYNIDGTRKSIEQLLSDFEYKKCNQNIPEKSDFKNSGIYIGYQNIYSIYYGLISKNSTSVDNSDLQHKIDLFMSENQDLITIEDMNRYYHSVETSDLELLYSRLYSYLKREEIEHDNSSR